MAFPRMLQIRQVFDAPRVDDVPAEVQNQLKSLPLEATIKPGQSVAITAGSRGIANIAVIVKATVDYFRSLDACPFIVPSMGSHGGATAEGQRQVLADYGITPDTMGCEIRSSIETVSLADSPFGIPIHFDRHASQADHVFLVGRIKPHTDFTGDVESGLHKMMLIGLGKHAGAKLYHRAMQSLSFTRVAKELGPIVIEKGRILAGLAILENAYDDTACIEAIATDRLFEREAQLLKQAYEWLPRLPFPEADILVVDRLGKNISGTGMDTNVIGRKHHFHAGTELDRARVRRVFVRSLTPESHGNGCGIGLAEYTNQRTLDSIDWDVTRTNIFTSGRVALAMSPLAFETDREVMEAALSTNGLTRSEDARVIHIADTLHLEHAMVSESYGPEIDGRCDLEMVSSPEPMQFDSQGNLLACPK